MHRRACPCEPVVTSTQLALLSALHGCLRCLFNTLPQVLRLSESRAVSICSIFANFCITWSKYVTTLRKDGLFGLRFKITFSLSWWGVWQQAGAVSSVAIGLYDDSWSCQRILTAESGCESVLSGPVEPRLSGLVTFTHWGVICGEQSQGVVTPLVSGCPPWYTQY